MENFWQYQVIQRLGKAQNFKDDDTRIKCCRSRTRWRTSGKSKVVLVHLIAPYFYLLHILSNFKYGPIKSSFLRISRVVCWIPLIGTYSQPYSQLSSLAHKSETSQKMPNKVWSSQESGISRYKCAASATTWLSIRFTVSSMSIFFIDLSIIDSTIDQQRTPQVTSLKFRCPFCW